MATLSPASSITLPTLQFFQDQSREASADKSYAEAREIFDRVIGANYGHGKGYSRVRALFLTWQDDDMHCKETEVSILKDILHNKFHFETDYFEIPSEKCQTSLQKKISEFCLENDDPDHLSILYYGGHGYIDKDTNQYKLAACKADGNGDPSVFFNDIRTCLRQPDCDQLVILDCCFSATAYSPDRVGKRKFELFTSSAHDVESSAPRFEGSFTRALNQALQKLLEENKSGFLTSDLFSELYHSMPKDRPRPHWFDQSRHDYGKIRLRPHNLTAIEDIFAFVKSPQIFNSLFRLRNRTRARMKTVVVREGSAELRASGSVKVPGKEMSQNLTLKSPTSPLAQGTMCSHTKIASGPILPTKTQVEVPGTEAVASGSLLAGKLKRGYSERGQAIDVSDSFHIDMDMARSRHKRQRTASPD